MKKYIVLSLGFLVAGMPIAKGVSTTQEQPETLGQAVEQEAQKNSYDKKWKEVAELTYPYCRSANDDPAAEKETIQKNFEKLKDVLESWEKSKTAEEWKKEPAQGKAVLYADTSYGIHRDFTGLLAFMEKVGPERIRELKLNKKQSQEMVHWLNYFKRGLFGSVYGFRKKDDKFLDVIFDEHDGSLCGLEEVAAGESSDVQQCGKFWKKTRVVNLDELDEHDQRNVRWISRQIKTCSALIDVLKQN